MITKPFWLKWVVYLCIILLPLGVFYWQMPFVGKMSLSNDYVSYPIQNQMDLQFSIKHGSFPLYVPGYGGGQTSAALTQGQMYHPFFYIYSMLPGYWHGDALLWNTLLRLLSLGCAHLLLFILLQRLKLQPFIAFMISFITVYNMRMLDLFRYGSSLENYTGYLFLCAAIAFYYLKPTPIKGPISIIAATYVFICGGHPQMMYLAALGAAISTLIIPFILDHITENPKQPLQNLKKYYLTVCLCGLSGILLAAAYIFPFYNDFLLLNSQRAAQNFKWSADFSDTIGGLLNNFFRPLQSDVHGAFGSSPVIILILLLPLFLFIKKKTPISVLLLWLSFVIIILCSLGKQTPLYYLFWKYFPLANVFRCPPRINVALPFLFLLMLAWLFHNTQEGFKLGKQPFSFSAPLALAICAIPVFVLYNMVLIKGLPAPGIYIPAHIQTIPPWVAPLLFALGFMGLLFIVVHLFTLPRSKKIWQLLTGMMMVAIMIFQVTVQLRYGSWVDPKWSQATLEMIARKKMKNLSSVQSLGDTMESDMVITQRERSIIERHMALFFQKYLVVPDQARAYETLATEDVTDRVVVEVPRQEKNPLPQSPKVAVGKDTVLLQESAYNRVQFSVTAAAAGFFALSYPYRTQWYALVDGQKSPVYRANGYMLGVYVPAGEHQVEFRYWSDAAFMGLLVSGFTFLLLGLFFSFKGTGKKRWLGFIAAVFIPASITWIWYSSLYSGDNLHTEYSWASTEFPTSGNLAYAKKTAMSSGTYSLNYAGIGVDGNKVKSFKTENYKQEWWEVDLGKPHPVATILLYDKSFKGKTQLPLQIWGSLDRKQFILLTELTERGTETPWRISLNGAITRYIRLQPPKKTMVSFTEIEVYPSH